MASKVLDLLIKVTDQASEELEAIKGSTTGEGSGIDGLGDSLLVAAGYATMAALAIQKIGKFAGDNLEEFTGYVLEVDRLAKAFGLSTEEAEQVVLMADAMNVSNDALFSTLNKLARDGMGVGIEALEGLREEFQAVEDPAARAELLFGKAGEQGQKVLAPMLDMTQLEWDEFKAGIEALTSVDDEMVKNAQELDLAMKGVVTKWSELKLVLANWSAPGLTALLELLLTPLSPDSAAAFLQGMGLDKPGSIITHDPRYTGSVGHADTGKMADRDRWDAIADAMADKVGRSVKDAVERID